MNDGTAAYLRLRSMVDRAEAPAPVRPRTEAEEDSIAIELLILENEGPDALERYQCRKAAQ